MPKFDASLKTCPHPQSMVFPAHALLYNIYFLLHCIVYAVYLVNYAFLLILHSVSNGLLFILYVLNRNFKPPDQHKNKTFG
jgi:hypothetical protein